MFNNVAVFKCGVSNTTMRHCTRMRRFASLVFVKKLQKILATIHFSTT